MEREKEKKRVNDRKYRTGTKRDKRINTKIWRMEQLQMGKNYK
jgi:hypothetical protein